MNYRILSSDEALNYEVRSSWIIQHCKWYWLQIAAGWYFTLKVRLKYPRYRRSFEHEELRDALNALLK